MFWSATPLITAKAGFTLLALNIFFLFVCWYTTWSQLTMFICWSSVPVALMSFVIRRTSNSGTTEGGGLAGVLYSKNDLGAVMAVATLLWVLTSIYDSGKRWFSISASAICFLLLLRAQSGGALSLFIILSILLLVTQVVKKFRYRSAVIALTSYLFIAILSTAIVFFNLEFILGLLGKDLSFTGRTDIWPAVWKAVSHRIWTGYGLHGFWQYWRGLDNPSLDWFRGYWSPPNSHFGYLDIWVQLGVFGILSLICAISISFFQSIRHLIHAKEIQAFIPLILLTYFTLSNLSETRLLDVTFSWVVYVLTSIKLSIGNTSYR